MSDPVERARHFRDRAEECEKLAELASNDESKAEYRKMALQYVALAEEEELFVSGGDRGESDLQERQ